MQNRCLIFLILFFIFSAKVFAEDLNVQKIEINRLDFKDAVSVALRNNNEIKGMRNALSATERDIGIVRSDLMPKVRLHENFMVTNNPIEAFGIKLNQTRAKAGDLAFGTLDYPGATTNFFTSGVIEQTLYNRKAMIALLMAKKEHSANGYLYLRKEEELANKVAKAYLEVNTAQELTAVTIIKLSTVKEYLKIAEIKYKKKLSPYSDVLRAKTLVFDAEQKLISVQSRLNVAKRNLGLVLGLENIIEISNSIPNIKLQDLEYYKSFAIYRNDLKATEIKVENAKNNIKSAQSDWFPTINAVASYNLYNSNYPFGAQGNSYIAGAYLKWDAFDGNKRKYEILKAKDKEAESKEYLEDTRKNICFKVYESYANVEELRKNVELAIAAQKAAADGRKLVFDLWENSRSNFIDLVDAQNNLGETTVNMIKSQNDLKAALINLNFESGIILQELGLK